MVPCEHAERDENCGRTDCFSCGRQASAQLRAEALLSPAGVIALAREVVRVQGSRSDHVVTVADLAWIRGWHQSASGDDREQAHREALAWAEGVIAAIEGRAVLLPDDYVTAKERVAFKAGVHFVREHA